MVYLVMQDKIPFTLFVEKGTQATHKSSQN